MAKKHKQKQWRKLVEWYANYALELSRRLETERLIADDLAYAVQNFGHKASNDCFCRNCVALQTWAHFRNEGLTDLITPNEVNNNG